MIPLNIPTCIGKEHLYLDELLLNRQFFYERNYTRKCNQFFERMYPGSKALLTNSCTQALELAAIILDLKAGDEVIMPSYTYVSTANAFVLRNVTPVFVDIRPDTLNIDERLIEQAITPRTKAIVPIDYGGVGCEMQTIRKIADKHGLPIVEDSAHGVMAKYKGAYLGTHSDICTISFDYMKNISDRKSTRLKLQSQR